MKNLIFMIGMMASIAPAVASQPAQNISQIHIKISGETSIALRTWQSDKNSENDLDSRFVQFEKNCPVVAGATYTEADNRTGAAYDIVSWCLGDGTAVAKDKVIHIHLGSYDTQFDADLARQQLIQNHGVINCDEGGFYVSKSTGNAELYCRK